MWFPTMIGCLLVVGEISTTRQLPQHPSPYQFGYTVRVEETGDYKTHHEVNDGEEVRGVYSVGEPNGDLRVVNYTADRAHGFRAMVTVHPGASPLKHGENDTHNPIHSKQNTLEETLTFNQTQQNNIHIRDDTTNNNTTTLGKVKTVNSSLFDVLPGLDKHVPKIEYIVDQDYEYSDAIPVFLKTINLNSSNSPQVVPVKIQEDPYDNSLELVESDSGTGTDLFTKVKNGNLSSEQELQESLTEEVSFPTSATPDSVKNTHIPQLKSSSYLTQFSEQTTTKLSQINEQNMKYTTETSISEDSIPTLLKPIENQTLKQNSTESKSGLVETAENLIENGVINQKGGTFPKVTETNDDTKKGQETALSPENNIILTTLMLPSPPIIKFTCVPDAVDESGIKLTPIMSNISPTSPNIPQHDVRYAPPKSSVQGLPVLPYPKNTITTPLDPLYQLINNRIYPLNSIHSTSQDGLSKFTNPHLYLPRNPVTNIPYNSAISGGSSMDPQKTTLSVPTVEITPPPTKPYPSLVNSGYSNKVHNLMHSRNSPLYPIPYPWIYHPVRPSHSYHPRHLPVFVLPMSHNVNFARTFDPQSFDPHNN